MKSLASILALLALLALLAIPALAWWGPADGNRFIAVNSKPDYTVGLVSRWVLNSNAIDSVDGLSAIVTNATAVSGHNGLQGYLFDGASSYLQFPTEYQTQMTFSAWIKIASLSPSVQTISEQRNGSSLTFFFFLTGGKPKFIVDNSSGTDYATDPTSETSLSTNVWYMVTGTASGDGIIRCYLNGVQYGAISSGWNLTTVSYPNFFFGRDDPNPTTRTLNGIMNDARLYNVGITSNQVMQVYKATK